MKVTIRRVHYGVRRLREFKFWFHWWTPVWHEGRGPYISIGLGLFGVYRGY